jgi:uncharacterized ferritin-like protein (DUF455 family)
LTVVRRGSGTPKPESLIEARFRAKLIHTFWHHELQAAELMCWALLAFSSAEPAFRRGLLRIAEDEIRHMHLYEQHLHLLGYAVGDFPVRDWFWERVPSCESALSFVALMGMGLEAANLEHAPKFAAQFRAAGDEVGAALQERVAREEEAHVRFGTRWFSRWTNGCTFDTWRAQLPEPLSPLILRGHPLAVAARVAAGMPAQFVDALAKWRPEDDGAPR